MTTVAVPRVRLTAAGVVRSEWVKLRSVSRPGDQRPQAPRAERRVRSVQASASGSMMRWTVCTMPPS